jgi:hypothetical protein
VGHLVEVDDVVDHLTPLGHAVYVVVVGLALEHVEAQVLPAVGGVEDVDRHPFVGEAALR